MVKLTLRVIQGADRGRIFPDLSPPFTIGRDEGNLVKLNDPRVSRFHVKIEAEEDHLLLADLDTVNGTRVNGQACDSKVLHHGDLIWIGRTILIVGCREEITSRDWDGYLEDSDVYPIKLSLPRGLCNDQNAELLELLRSIYSPLQQVLDESFHEKTSQVVVVNQLNWASLLRTQSDIATLIRSIDDQSDIQSDQGRELSDLSSQELCVENYETLINSLRQVATQLGSRRVIRYVGSNYIELAELIRKGDEKATMALREGFANFSFFDGLVALSNESCFDCEQFQRHIYETLATVHRLPIGEFHPADIAETLRSVDSSLFCFIGVERFSDETFKLLRGLGFFQSHHFLVYIGDSSYFDRLRSNKHS